LAAVGLVLRATYLAHVQPSAESGALGILVMWIAGVALAVIASLSPSDLQVGARRWRRDAAAVAILFGLALVLRLAGLAQFPDAMSGDEGSMAMEAKQILAGEWINPFGTGWLSHHNLFFYLEALALRLFGENLFGLRFTAAVLGSLGVPAVYLLARWAFGRETAWIAGALAAGWGLAVHFSRLALNNSADVLFGAVVVALLQRGLVRGRRGYFVLSGLALGTSLYFYHGTRLLIPVVVIVSALSARRLQRRWQGLLVFCFVAALVCGPLTIHFVRQPDQFLSRSQEIDIFESGWLEREVVITGRSTAWVLARQLGHALFAFIYTPDQGYFYRPGTPMLDVLSGALFVLGVALAAWRWRELRYAVLLIWIGLTVLFGGFWLTSPPHYQRYLIAGPAACVLIGRAGVVVIRRLARRFGWKRDVRRAVVLGLAAVLLAVNVGGYFAVYVPGGAFNWDRNTLVADRAARLMADLGSEYTTYFLATPNMGLHGFNSVRFLAPGADWIDVLTPMAEGWDFVMEARGAFFVVPNGERIRELEMLYAQFPTGVEERVFGPRGELLFVTYRVPPGDV